MMTSAETMLFAVANFTFEMPRSATTHAEKKSVAMFIEKIVLEKSYSAQLQRSLLGASAVGEDSIKFSAIASWCVDIAEVVEK